MSQEDTIVAIATPMGMGGVGVIRVSGPEALNYIRSMIDRPPKTIKPRYLYHGWIKDVDEVLYAYMQAPKSYTGEDVLEISCHGSSAILQKVLRLCVAAGARQALPGEFTKRAYLNGKIDLTQAEAVLAIVQSKTEEAAVVAVGQVAGKLKDGIGEIKKALLATLARIEASIDFPDDIEKSASKEIAGMVGEALAKTEEMLAEAQCGEVLKGGVRVAITGRPNVGKSSLLNYLAGHERAIVTDTPGTTRDVIEELIDLDGIPVRLMDTAGLRSPRGRAEKEGVARARRQAEKADIVLLLVDATRPKMTAEEGAWYQAQNKGRALLVVNKVDLGRKMKADGVPISAKKGTGIKPLLGAIKAAIMGQAGASDGSAMILSARQTGCLKRAKKALQKAGESIRMESDDVVVAIDIKEALVALSEMTGEAVSEAVIEKIFAEFCVGK